MKDGEHFFKATRMSIPKFYTLLSLIQERLQRFSSRAPISPASRLALTLMYLSQGCSPQYLSWSHKLGVSTVKEIVYDTCTQCALFCGIQEERAWELNQQRSTLESADLTSEPEQAVLDNSTVPYTREMFDALCLRFEEPNSNCRWDSSLFVCFPDDHLDLEAIYRTLFESKPLPPNLSTQNPPLSSTNYYFELDHLTQEIVADVLAARKIGILSPIPAKGSETKINIPTYMNAIQLNRLRRQFLNYSKLNHATTSSLDKVPQLFVQFLNSNCGQ